MDRSSFLSDTYSHLPGLEKDMQPFFSPNCGVCTEDLYSFVQKGAWLLHTHTNTNTTREQIVKVALIFQGAQMRLFIGLDSVVVS